MGKLRHRAIEEFEEAHDRAVNLGLSKLVQGLRLNELQVHAIIGLLAQLLLQNLSLSEATELEFPNELVNSGSSSCADTLKKTRTR